jgi:hypothetical protein
MNLKFEHHNVPLITVLREMLMCSILWCIRVSECQKSLSLIFWTQITYQSFSTYWVMLEIGILRIRLTNSHIGSGLKALPLN